VVAVLSDKLFFWLFQNHPDRIISLCGGLPLDAAGYSFVAPVLKEREYRLDGLFRPPAERPELPALILEAQMAPDPGFLRRLYAESARLLQQEPAIHRWQVVVITPSRLLNFGAPEPVAEFLAHRVRWVELQRDRWVEPVPLFQRVLALLLEPERELPSPSEELRLQATGSALESDLDGVIAAILISRFPSRSIPEICAMGGITVEDFTKSRIYQEIAGIGRQEGEAAVTLRQLARRCGPLSAATTARIQALPLEQLEALAEALLDFQGAADLTTWLANHG
jgi:predicted transposase YdaD